MTTTQAEALRRAAALVFVADLDAPELAAHDSHHLLDALRLRDGEIVVAATGDGRYRLCRLARPQPGRAAQAGAGAASPERAARRARPALLEPAGEMVTAPPPAYPVGVGFALQKGDRPEWTVQKLTELGVDEIYPLVTARSVVRLDPSAAAQRVERLRRVAREAAAQSRRVRLPALHELAPIAEVVRALAPGLLAGGAPGATSAGPGALGGAPGPVLAIAEPGAPLLQAGVTHLLVGPEGGFVGEELDLVETRARLATLVLRAETAAIAAGYLLAARRDGIGLG